MDCHHCITECAERKKGQHLRMEDRGAIKVLKKQGLGPRAIARQIGCAPSTVTNELRRGTPARKSSKGKAPGYSPKLGEAVYRANRASCHRHPKAGVCSNFTSWVVRQIREHKWSLDACCGYAKRHGLFEPSEMVCSRTLYNMVWKGHLSIQPMELPEVLKRKAKKHRVRENKKRYGTSISSRPGHGRKFCVSDFRQTQEYHSYNVHNRANTPCPPLSPSGWNGMRAGTA